MSHEIRTPLNGMLGVAELLEKSRLSAADRGKVGIILDSARALDRLLGDILDLARIEAGRTSIEMAPFVPGDALRAAAELARLDAAAKGLALEIDIDPSADGTFGGDIGRLRQIVTNLLSNAVKFTDAGTVRLVARHDGGALQVEVTDTGVGFDEESRRRIFRRFSQADGSITRRFGGTGLGLAIASELAQLMGGALDCESTPGQGSRFTLRLPAKPSDAPLAGPEEAVDFDLRGHTVLVADDHPVNRKVAEMILVQFGARVVTAQDGAEAVQAFTDGGVDLVLMDMQMPVMDGLTAVRGIREYEAEAGARPVPVLMLTANAMPEHRDAAHLAGANGFVTKPVTAAALTAGIATALAAAATPASEVKAA